MNDKSTVAVNINQDLCSHCSVCYSICPYDAVKREASTGRFEIELAKCQVCGICYSACPSSAVEMIYYDSDSLYKYIQDARKRRKTDRLVLMCRGNSPPTCEVERILQEKGLEKSDYIPLRLPCSGRVPTEFLLKAFKSGITSIVLIQCEDDFCRFKEGSRTNTRRALLARTVIQQLGLTPDALKVVKYSRKATYDAAKCVGCDKCIFVCPYDAIEAQDFATPKILQDRCMGCGACALVCPHSAIQVEGFEFESSLRNYMEIATELKGSSGNPLVLAFVCQWSEFNALDMPHSLFKKHIYCMEVPCFKALDPVHISNALSNGFDGVIGVVCSEEDCKLQEGRELAERNMDVLKNYLKKVGLIDRFELLTVSPRQVGDFSQKLEAFVQRLNSLQVQKPNERRVCADS